ncbi:MAG: STAS domain-containing protein [bacterium]
MEIVTTERDNVVILSLKGRLDFSSSTSLKERVMEMMREGRRQFVINMAQVDFINSSGLGTLVSVLKEVRLAKGRMALAKLGTYVQEIFEITQLSHIFEIFEHEEEAWSAVQSVPVTVN